MISTGNIELMVSMKCFFFRHLFTMNEFLGIGLSVIHYIHQPMERDDNKKDEGSSSSAPLKDNQEDLDAIEMRQLCPESLAEAKKEEKKDGGVARQVDQTHAEIAKLFGISGEASGTSMYLNLSYIPPLAHHEPCPHTPHMCTT